MISSAPEIGQIAEKNREIFNDYQMGKQTRLSRRRSGIARQGSSGDWHNRSVDQFYARTEIARDIDRNDMLVGQGIDRLCANILQHGFEPEPETGRASTDRMLKEKWQDYTEKQDVCDIQGEFDFNFLSWLVLRSSIVDGDIFGLPLKSGQIQLVESHRVRSPIRSATGTLLNNTIHGVSVDDNRRRLAYWVVPDSISIYESVHQEDAQRIDAYDKYRNKQVFHVWHPKRATLTRGVTKLAPCEMPISMHNDVQIAKLVQQQEVSKWTMVRERPMGFDLPEGVSPLTTERLDPASGSMRQFEESRVGSYYTTFPGEVFKAVNSNVPNPTFFDHARSIQQIVALNLGLPLVLFLLDASETNFSGWRGALDQAKIQFKQFQKWFSHCAWHRPVYLWKLRQWSNPRYAGHDKHLVKLRETAGDRMFKHDWIHPGWPYVQPEVERKSDIEALGNCLISPRRQQRERGRNWDRIWPEIIEDRATPIEAAIKQAMKLNAKYPENPRPIVWSDLIQFPNANGSVQSQTRSLQEEEPNDEPNSGQSSRQQRG